MFRSQGLSPGYTRCVRGVAAAMPRQQTEARNTGVFKSGDIYILFLHTFIKNLEFTLMSPV